MATLGKAPFPFTGLYRHNLDEKNRLTIPAVWRSLHGEEDTLLATPSPDGYIAVLPPLEVEKLYQKISALALSDSDAQEVVARFFSASQAFSFDKQGRVAFSDDLRRHAGIGKETVLVGASNKFNVYSPAAWARVEQKSGMGNVGDIMRRIGI